MERWWMSLAIFAPGLAAAAVVYLKKRLQKRRRQADLKELSRQAKVAKLHQRVTNADSPEPEPPTARLAEPPAAN